MRPYQSIDSQVLDEIEESWLEKTFHLYSRNSYPLQEFRAGVATFLTMSYILLVNPQILASVVGVDPKMIVVSTALSSAIGCFWTGYFGNMPFGLAPGIGLSAYLAYGLILGDGLSRTEAFTTCFISGLILLAFSISGISQVLMVVIPRSVKLATIVGMGLQIALVGMTSINLVVKNNETIVGLGDLHNYHIWLSFFGLITIGSLLFHQVEGGILIGISIMTFITWWMQDSFPTSYIQIPNLAIDITQFIDFSNFDFAKCIPGMAAFLFIGLIDVSGVIYGMSSLANLIDADGSIPGSKATFVAVSLSTLVSAMTGGTPIIIYVESATGIKDGGRTGLTAITIGFFFLLALLFAPVLASIPLTATSPVAILIGAMMMSQAKEIDWENMTDAIPGFLTLAIMPFTFSITNGIIFGLLASFCLYITTGQVFKDIRTFLNSRSGSPDLAETELIDPKPYVRTPSLILSKDDSESVKNANGGNVNPLLNQKANVESSTSYF